MRGREGGSFLTAPTMSAVQRLLQTGWDVFEEVDAGDTAMIEVRDGDGDRLVASNGGRKRTTLSKKLSADVGSAISAIEPTGVCTAFVRTSEAQKPIVVTLDVTMPLLVVSSVQGARWEVSPDGHSFTSIVIPPNRLFAVPALESRSVYTRVIFDNSETPGPRVVAVLQAFRAPHPFPPHANLLSWAVAETRVRIGEPVRLLAYQPVPYNTPPANLFTPLPIQLERAYEGVVTVYHALAHGGRTWLLQKAMATATAAATKDAELCGLFYRALTQPIGVMAQQSVHGAKTPAQVKQMLVSLFQGTTDADIKAVVKQCACCGNSIVPPAHDSIEEEFAAIRARFECGTVAYANNAAAQKQLRAAAAAEVAAQCMTFEGDPAVLEEQMASVQSLVPYETVCEVVASTRHAFRVCQIALGAGVDAAAAGPSCGWILVFHPSEESRDQGGPGEDAAALVREFLGALGVLGPHSGSKYLFKSSRKLPDGTHATQWVQHHEPGTTANPLVTLRTGFSGTDGTALQGVDPQHSVHLREGEENDEGDPWVRSALVYLGADNAKYTAMQSFLNSIEGNARMVDTLARVTELSRRGVVEE